MTHCRSAQRPGRILAAALALLAVAPAVARADSFEDPTILADTTAQIAPRLTDGELRLGIVERGNGRWHDPSRTVLSLGAPTGTVPDDPAFAFLGEPGSQIWRSTGTPEPRPAGVLRLGVSTVGVPVEEVAPGSQVTTTLRNVDGRNGAFLFEDDAQGRPVAQWFNSVDGLPDARALPPGADVVLGAAFGWTTIYCLDVTAAATLRDGRTVTDREWLTIVVGEDPATVRPCGAPGGVHVFDSRHLDLSPVVGSDGTVELKVHAEGLTDFDDTVFHARPASALALPPDGEGYSFRFLGAAGETVWNLPATIEGQDVTEILWPGFNLESAPDSAFQRQLTWRLDGVSSPDGSRAPGDVILWSDEAPQGTPPFFSTRVGLPDAYAVGSSAFGHFHLNWTFTRPGVYCLNFGVDGRSAAGGGLADSQLLTVVVGDLDPSAVAPCGRSGMAPPVARRPDVPSAGAPVVARSGSFELTPELRDGELRVPVHENDRFADGPGIDRSASDVVFYTREWLDTGFSGRPWLGQSGEPLYALRAEMREHQPTLGWDLTRIAPSALRGDLRWRLIDVAGPGTVGIHDDSIPSPERAVLGTVPGHEQRSWDLWPGTRNRRATWGFSSPGVHCVGLEWSGTLASGETVSRRETLTIVADVAPWRTDPDTGQRVEVPPTIDPSTVVPCGRNGEPPAEEPPPAPSPSAGSPPPGVAAAPERPRGLRVALRRPKVGRAGVLRVRCELDAPGRCAVRVWATAREARRLRLGRAKAVTLGRGAATLAAAGGTTVEVKLSRRARRALRRTRRARIRLTATGSAPGRPGASATVSATVRGGR